MESPLALTPDIGLEVVKCVETFLDMRYEALPKSNFPEQQDDEDDDYGMFDFDLNDPKLNELLGANVVEDPAINQDNEFAQVSKEFNNTFPIFITI